jgi:superfamily II DNA or RNA helicase
LFPVRSCILFTKNHSSCDSVEIVVANLRKAVLIVSDTPTPRVLRPYQLEATQRVEDSWANGKSRVSVVLPTGSGKSSVIANVATRARRTGKKALLLAHRTELLDQMAGAVQAVDPLGEEVGIVAAERDEHQADIVAASFQTLSRSPNRLAALGNRDVILADECHHISAATYTKVLEDMGALDPSFLWVHRDDVP